MERCQVPDNKLGTLYSLISAPVTVIQKPAFTSATFGRHRFSQIQTQKFRKPNSKETLFRLGCNFQQLAKRFHPKAALPFSTFNMSHKWVNSCWIGSTLLWANSIHDPSTFHDMCEIRQDSMCSQVVLRIRWAILYSRFERPFLMGLTSGHHQMALAHVFAKLSAHFSRDALVPRNIVQWNFLPRTSLKNWFYWPLAKRNSSVALVYIPTHQQQKRGWSILYVNKADLLKRYEKL